MCVYVVWCLSGVCVCEGGVHVVIVYGVCGDGVFRPCGVCKLYGVCGVCKCCVCVSVCVCVLCARRVCVWCV